MAPTSGTTIGIHIESHDRIKVKPKITNDDMAFNAQFMNIVHVSINVLRRNGSLDCV